MVRIRLRRTGKKGQPSYRVVVADKESPRDGRFIEIIGHYNPRTDPMTLSIEADRALYWLSQGAQPSDAVARLLRKEGVLARFEAIKRGAPDPGPAIKEEIEAGAEAESEVATEATAEAEAEVSEEGAEAADADVAATSDAAEASGVAEDQEEEAASAEGD
jgi:small subunit ribosomal protein S16